MWTEVDKKIVQGIYNLVRGEWMGERPQFDGYFLAIAILGAVRTTCDRGRQGCVITRDNNLLVMGYAGSPPGMPHCCDEGHELHEIKRLATGITSTHCVRTTHAEENAILQAAKHGISLNGGTLYCTMTPCAKCAGRIVSVGIKRVVCFLRYHALDALEILKRASVEIVHLSDETQEYEKQ